MKREWGDDTDYSDPRAGRWEGRIAFASAAACGLLAVIYAGAGLMALGSWVSGLFGAG